MAETDISRIINIIMENPKLLEEIKSLAEKDTAKDELPESAPPAEAEQSLPAVAPVSRKPETPPQASRRESRRRTELLEALKPYISDERKKAIETFMTVADILDMMREK